MWNKKGRDDVCEGMSGVPLQQELLVAVIIFIHDAKRFVQDLDQELSRDAREGAVRMSRSSTVRHDGGYQKARNTAKSMGA